MELKKIFWTIIFILIFITFFMYKVAKDIKPKTDWDTTYSGLLIYPENRGEVKIISDNIIEKNLSYIIEKIVYKSRGKDIYALYFEPTIKKSVPAIIMLPGARGKKENHYKLGKQLASKGYAFISIDQRGIGETDGNIPSTQEEVNAYLNNQEPVTHLMVYDVLKAFDVLKTKPKVDKVIVAGESMGARFALIAAAIDKNLQGVIVFSTSGYGQQNPKTVNEKFIASINPDMYVGKISPRKLVMFHSKNDSVIPYENAQQTFNLAKEPKHFITMPEPCDHGYCESMFDKFLEEISWVLKS